MRLRLGLCLALLAASERGWAQAPPEVGDLAWCPGTKNCLQWSVASGATSYKVHSGRRFTMPGLLNTTIDSCVSTSTATTSTGPSLDDTPPPCSLFWYIVDGVNASGEGTAGNATAGARLLTSSGSCTACAAGGAACVDDDSCCSGRCFEGTCQDACCKPAGVTCTTGADCCSGLCNAGVCAPTIQCPYGQAACNGVCVTPPTGVCATQGVCLGQTISIFCRDQVSWACNYSSVANVETDASGNLVAQEQRCDAKDGNCNGTVDVDGFPTVGQACGTGLGVCRNTGNVVCTSQTSAGCNAVPNNAVAIDERCDGVDNNCDGQIDERLPLPPNVLQGWRDPAVPVQVGTGTVWVYQYEASRPGATVFSPGLQSSRACSVSGVLPWSTVTQAQAAAACAAVKDSAGASMRLCSAEEWTVACEGVGGASTFKWSQSVNPTTYASQICNDVNQAACSAVWATGSPGVQSPPTNNFCYTDWIADGRIRDLSGNVAEWTSSTVVSNGVTYYTLRGGSFFSPSGGTTCEFDGRWAQAAFASNDVGFRCCSDNAP